MLKKAVSGKWGWAAAFSVISAKTAILFIIKTAQTKAAGVLRFFRLPSLFVRRSFWVRIVRENPDFLPRPLYPSKLPFPETVPETLPAAYPPELPPFEK